MKRFRRLVLPLFVVAVGAIVAAAPAQTKKSSPSSALIKRGAYLVTIAGCNDCHSPKVFTKMGPAPDTTRLLSGHPASDALPALPAGLIAPAPDKWGAITTNDLTAWVGSWGTSYPANLTPDEETGLGSWTESMFIGALRTGKHMGVGRDILPPMPWQMIGQMTTDDMKAVFAYLRSLKPIHNAVPDPIAPDGKTIPTPRKLD